MKQGSYIHHEFGANTESHYANSLGWLAAGCFSSIPWPEEDEIVTYDGER